ncbi:MAG: hypothetical protein AAF639_21650 [Chloroflexota bacterium]
MIQGNRLLAGALAQPKLTYGTVFVEAQLRLKSESPAAKTFVTNIWNGGVHPHSARTGERWLRVVDMQQFRDCPRKPLI